jgi:hypothetical protein
MASCATRSGTSDSDSALACSFRKGRRARDCNPQDESRDSRRDDRHNPLAGQLFHEQSNGNCDIILARQTTASYAVFFPAFNFAHLARCTAAIFLRAETEIIRFAGVEAVVFASATGCDSLRAFAHLALCACAIFRREAAEIIRAGGFAFQTVPNPFSDSITEIA